MHVRFAWPLRALFIASTVVLVVLPATAALDESGASVPPLTCPSAVLDRFESQNSFRVISTTTILKIKKLELLDCAARCATEPACGAFNFRRRTGMCVLKRASKSDLDSGVANTEWTFYTLSQACIVSLPQDVVEAVILKYRFMIPSINSASSEDAVSSSRESLESAAEEVIRQHRTAGLTGSNEEIARTIIGQRPLCGSDDHAHTVPRDVAELDVVAERAALWALEDRITIKLVFHIVHDGAANKIETTSIQDQIEVLNSAFSGGTHKDGVDTNIRFKFDRVNYLDNTKYAQDCRAELFVSGGHVETDPSVINIFACYDPYWIGWAYLPWVHPEESPKSQITINPQTFPGGSLKNLNFGYTLVHEMGHHLGLLHTFSASACSEFTGDNVADTPLEKSANFGCSEQRDTCTSDSGNDPIWSFMDYTPDQCMNRFSFGQVVRMQALIPRYKPKLLKASLMSSPCYQKTAVAYCNGRGTLAIAGPYCTCACEDKFAGSQCQTLRTTTTVRSTTSSTTTSATASPATPATSIDTVDTVVFEQAPTIISTSATSVHVRVRYRTFYTPLIVRVVLYYQELDKSNQVAGVFRGKLDASSNRVSFDGQGTDQSMRIAFIDTAINMSIPLIEKELQIRNDYVLKVQTWPSGTFPPSLEKPTDVLYNIVVRGPVTQATSTTTAATTTTTATATTTTTTTHSTSSTTTIPTATTTTATTIVSATTPATTVAVLPANEIVKLEQFPRLILSSAASVRVRVNCGTWYTPVILRVMIFYRNVKKKLINYGVYRGMLKEHLDQVQPDNGKEPSGLREQYYNATFDVDIPLTKLLLVRDGYRIKVQMWPADKPSRNAVSDSVYNIKVETAQPPSVTPPPTTSTETSTTESTTTTATTATTTTTTTTTGTTTGTESSTTLSSTTNAGTSTAVTSRAVQMSTAANFPTNSVPTVTLAESVAIITAPKDIPSHASNIRVRVRYGTRFTPLILRVSFYFRTSIFGQQILCGVYRGKVVEHVDSSLDDLLQLNEATELASINEQATLRANYYTAAVDVDIPILLDLLEARNDYVIRVQSLPVGTSQQYATVDSVQNIRVHDEPVTDVPTTASTSSGDTFPVGRGFRWTRPSTANGKSPDLCCTSEGAEHVNYSLKYGRSLTCKQLCVDGCWGFNYNRKTKMCTFYSGPITGLALGSSSNCRCFEKKFDVVPPKHDLLDGGTTLAPPSATPPTVAQSTSPTPTATTTSTPTASPTVDPTASPTASPTATPTANPTATPTANPTATPTAAPTATPTAAPTAAPTTSPTAAPTTSPTGTPTASPTAAPTATPTTSPTGIPTASPTAAPTETPTPPSTSPGNAIAVVSKTCNIESGWDYAGNDLGNRKVGNVNKCIKLCINVEKCSHFTFLWKRCWMKTASTGRVQNSKAVSGACNNEVRAAQPSFRRSCSIIVGVDYDGNDLTNIVADSAESCVPLCLLRDRCSHFTYAWGRCYLKWSGGGEKIQPAAKSGICRTLASTSLEMPEIGIETPKKCAIDIGFDFLGNDLWQAPALSVDECVKGCIGECTHFTFAWGRCFYKSSSAGRKVQPRATSGTCI